MKNQAKAYLKEEKWFHEKYVPAIEEYMSLALETCAYRLLTTTSFIGMGDVASENAFEWLNRDPKILRSSKVICRLMDDIVSREVNFVVRITGSDFSDLITESLSHIARQIQIF